VEPKLLFNLGFALFKLFSVLPLLVPYLIEMHRMAQEALRELANDDASGSTAG